MGSTIVRMSFPSVRNQDRSRQQAAAMSETSVSVKLMAILTNLMRTLHIEAGNFANFPDGFGS